MLRYKDTILVVHPSGGYGRFLAWCLAYFSGELEEYSNVPHAKSSTHSKSIAEGAIHFGLSDCNISRTTVEYLTGSDEFKFGNTVGQFNDIQKQKSYVHDYQHFFKKIVLLTQDPSCQLMLFHNIMKRTRVENQHDFFDNIIARFREQFAAQDPVPTWQLREMISFDHYSYLRYVPDLYQPIVSSKVVNVPIRQLIHHFQNTVTKLLQQLDLPLVHSNQFDRISKEWLSKEHFTNIDYLCQDIVTATLEGSDVSWHADQLTIIDEAFIQFQLRSKNFEMRCYGVDTFPTNSVQLKELLYPV
jgi:hypothetical protein